MDLLISSRRNVGVWNLFLDICFVESVVKSLIACDKFAPISFALILNFLHWCLFTVMRREKV